jgi:trans-AT polyketide synthase/acyltransferase/oxidoreductase domain-containing protein
VYEETRNYYLRNIPGVVERADHDPKFRMALIFRWYFVRAHRLAVRGDMENKVDFQIQCGPALGAFNQWARGTCFESWRQRHVDEIAEWLMTDAARLLAERYQKFHTGGD